LTAVLQDRARAEEGAGGACGRDGEVARADAVSFEAQLNEARSARAEAEARAAEAISAREDTITASVREANLRADLAESHAAGIKAHYEEANGALRAENKELQVKLFRFRDAVNAL
jgi:hypothetical protein